MQPGTNLAVNDRVQMRKMHPCGSDIWVVYRIGADVGIRCTGCDRRVMLPYRQFRKQLKRHIAPSNESGGEQP